MYLGDVQRNLKLNFGKGTEIKFSCGVTLNGQQIYSEALGDLEKLEQEIRTTYELNPAIMIG